MALIYKILSRIEWETALRADVFEGTALDRKDGYIHLSTAAQAQETARRHFAGQVDLVLISFDVAVFGDAIKWEPSRGGDLFPHLYAPLPTAAARDVRPLALDGEGIPQLGPHLDEAAA